MRGEEPRSLLGAELQRRASLTELRADFLPDQAQESG